MYPKPMSFFDRLCDEMLRDDVCVTACCQRIFVALSVHQVYREPRKRSRDQFPSKCPAEANSNLSDY